MRLFIGGLVTFIAGGIVGHALAAADPMDEYLPLNAAPDHHRAILENDRVRVLDVRIAPGETVPAHQHDLPSVFVTLAPADLVLRDLSGETVRDLRRNRDSNGEPEVEWRGPAPAPRVVTNLDTVEMRALRIEFKAPAK